MELFKGELARKHAIRAGFGVVLALGLFSMIEAARIQERVSSATADVYRRHVEQDEIRFELRRTLWMAASGARDYLLNPSEDREAEMSRQLNPQRARSYELMSQLEKLPESAELRRRLDEFWQFIGNVPQATAHLDPAARYQFVQREVASRRNALGDLLREWDRMSRSSFSESQFEMDSIGRFAASRLFWILGLALAASVLVALLCLRYSERLEREAQEHHRQVERSKDELARLSNRLMQVQEEERARLARELHDEIGQSLATMRLEIARAAALPENRAAEIRERLGRARALTDALVQAIRTTCMLLRPSLLDDLGLIPAIQWLAEDFERRTGLVCEFSSEGVDDELPETVRTCVYRVVQESLHNSEKHADARTVRIRLDQSGGALTAVIDDDGRGFEAEGPLSGMRFGLLGMSERAAAAGGRLAVSSVPGRGTRVELWIPAAPARLAAAAATARV